MPKYDKNSLKAEEFINDGEIKDTLKFADENKDNLELIDKIIEKAKPKYLLMENVKNIVGKNFKGIFDTWLSYLESLGYTNYYQVLNAKDFGLAQNRERVMMVSILGDHKPYKFTTSLNDTSSTINSVLEDNIDEIFEELKKRVEAAECAKNEQMIKSQFMKAKDEYEFWLNLMNELSEAHNN